MFFGKDLADMSANWNMQTANTRRAPDGVNHYSLWRLQLQVAAMQGERSISLSNLGRFGSFQDETVFKDHIERFCVIHNLVYKPALEGGVGYIGW